MNNLATFTLSVLMAYTVCAQSPFLSSPYYFYNENVLPIQHNAPVPSQNVDQYLLQRDAIVSVMLREFKENSKRWAETNVAVDNLKRQVTDLKNEVAQLTKTVGEKDEVKSLKKNETEILPTEFEPFNIDYGSHARNPTARYCSCRTFHDIFNLMSKTLDDTQSKFNAITNAISKDLAAMDVKFTGITNDINKDLVDTNADLKSITDQLQDNLDDVNDKLEDTTGQLTEDLADTNSNLNSLEEKFQESINPTSIDKEPTSCADLEDLGYKNSGIFSIKVNNQVLNVYCDFKKSGNPTAFQKLIGIVDVKTIRVSFHVQLKAAYTTALSIVPFDVIVTNVGSGMSTTTGIFKAPVAGTYFFAFVGLSVTKKEARVELHKKSGAGSFSSVARSFGSNYDKETFAMDAILVLKKDDEICVYLFQGEINDSATHNTNFVGFLIEEETV